MTTGDVDAAAIITVVIPTFNRVSQLRKAVDSVLQEIRVPIRLRIFDNASTDGTAEYVQSLAQQDKRVTYVRNLENVGSIPNYTKALASIETEFFVPLADDDWLLPEFLHDAHVILTRDPDLAAAVFVTEGRDEEGTLLTTFPHAEEDLPFGRLEPADHLRRFMTYGHYGWSSILWRRSVLEIIGAPYFHTGLPSDVDVQLQVFSRLPAYLVNRVGAVYLLHAAQYSRGYSVVTAPSWARLFQRLDAVVLRDGVLSWTEYLPLRHQMAQRYRALWRNPSEHAVSAQTLLRAAYASGVHLGDWEQSFSLLAEVDGSVAVGPEEVIALPDGVDCSFASVHQYRNAEGLRGRIKAFLRWMREQVVRQAEMQRVVRERDDETKHLVSVLSDQRDVLGAELAELKVRHALVQGELDAARGRLQALEQALDAERSLLHLARHELAEAHLLGSLRYVPRRLIAKVTGRTPRLPRGR